MALQKDETGPYAPPQVMLAVLERHRERGLPQRLDSEGLVRAGLATESLASRTLQAMKVLDWLDDDGNPRPGFEELRKVASEDYKERLAALLRVAYADVLTFADPQHDSLERLTDAFRWYTPASMRPRMVTLFINLMEYAEVVPEGRFTSKRTRTGKRSPANAARSTTKPRAAADRAPQRPAVASRTAEYSEPVSAHPSSEPVRSHKLPPALAGFVNALPTAGETLSDARRQKYIDAFKALLDISYDAEGDDNAPAA